MVTIFLQNLGIALLAISSVVGVAIVLAYIVELSNKKFGILGSMVVIVFLSSIVAALLVTFLGYK